MPAGQRRVRVPSMGNARFSGLQGRRPRVPRTKRRAVAIRGEPQEPPDLRVKRVKCPNAFSRKIRFSSLSEFEAEKLRTRSATPDFKKNY